MRMQNISRFLIGQGHQVHWVAGWFPGCSELPPEPGLRLTFVGKTPKLRAAFYALRALSKLRKFSREADVVVEDFSPYAPIFSWGIKSVPIVLQLQNYVGKHFLVRNRIIGPLLFWIESVYPRLFSHIVVVGDALRHRFSIDAAVIPQGVSESAFAVSPEAGSYIAFLGRIDFDQKGIDLLLDAAAKTGLPIRIAGGGTELPRLLKALEPLPNVVHVGYLGELDKFDFLARSRFAVLPSRFEGEPTSVVETAACGKAVLVSNIPEMAYAVEEGFGRAFRSGDADDLARTMTELWADVPKLEAMGRAGRKFAEDRAWSAIGNRFETYLLDVIRKFAALKGA